jgi:hypothetical protein
MGNMKYWIGVVVVLLGGPVVGQTVLEQKTSQLSDLRAKEKELIAEIESLKLQESMRSLNAVGFPVSQKDLEIIEHSGMALGFDCDYKMAAWAFHQLTPDVSSGIETRSNDFRVDDKPSCGSAVGVLFKAAIRNT